MAFLMAPESFIFVHGVRISGQLKAVVLFALFIVSIKYRFEEPSSESDLDPLITSSASATS